MLGHPYAVVILLSTYDSVSFLEPFFHS
jgi:hypothetical protein